MAQAVKLVTFFATVAPFIAMSFLLGGIDFVTILISLVLLFLLSLWVSAAFLFLSTLPQSRAMSGVVFGAAGFIVIFVFMVSRIPYFLVTRGGMGADVDVPARGRRPGGRWRWSRAEAWRRC